MKTWLFINKGCESGGEDYIGDGYCDDANNNEGCQFDDGDCCGPEVLTDYCDECICHETSFSSSGTTQTPETTSGSGATNGGGTFYIFEATF